MLNSHNQKGSKKNRKIDGRWRKEEKFWQKKPKGKSEEVIGVSNRKLSCGRAHTSLDRGTKRGTAPKLVLVVGWELRTLKKICLGESGSL